MTQILLLVQHSENRRLLTEYLRQHYSVRAVNETELATSKASLLDESFGLCIIDGIALSHLWEAIQARKQQEAPVFLPVLLITARADVKLITRNLWAVIDELITRPLEKAELRVRIEMLLRSRRYSVQLSEALTRERELGEMRLQFIAIASHEFRNPLNLILGFTQLLEKGQNLTAEKKATLLQRIQTAVKRMVDLLDDVLVLSKFQINNSTFNPVPLSVQSFCRLLVEEVQLSLENPRTIDVSHDCQEDIKVLLDEGLLRRILTNLLTNAIKYSPLESIVSLSLQCTDDVIIFKVQDTGIGISPEDQSRLFEAFYRATNARSMQGTGLGLAIVKQAVDHHGGKISFESAIGAGTTFTVTLPIIRAHEASR